MRSLAKRWYHWRWSQVFVAQNAPDDVEVPLAYRDLFPLGEQGPQTTESCRQLCAELDGFQGESFTAEALRLHYLMSAEGGDSAASLVLRYQNAISALQRTRRRLHAAASLVPSYWGDLPDGAFIAGLRAQFMTNYAPSQNLDGILDFYEEIGRRINRCLLAKKHKRPAAISAAKRMFDILRELDAVVGIFSQPSDAFLQLERRCAIGRAGLDLSEIEQKVSLRIVARTGRDWATADRLKTELNEIGIILSDEDGHTDWWFEAEGSS